MASAGQIAVLQDVDGLNPPPTPAIYTPVRQGLGSLLAERRLLHFCHRDAAASISSQGLRPGSWCTTTPLSSYVADIWLGLPSRRNYVFVFDPREALRFQGPGISLADPGDALRSGGAVEFYFPDGIPASAIVNHGPLEEP